MLSQAMKNNKEIDKLLTKDEIAAPMNTKRIVCENCSTMKPYTKPTACKMITTIIIINDKNIIIINIIKYRKFLYELSLACLLYTPSVSMKNVENIFKKGSYIAFQDDLQQMTYPK